MLYFVQGLPYGFQSRGLKLALTALGLSMTKVTLASLLSVPWSLKPLIAPFVDRHGSVRFGRRKSWIVPLQGGLGLTCLAAAFCPPDTRLDLLLVCVLFMNVFAASQDVPVDGLAVDVLGPEDLGVGNAVQVVGYKVGMLIGGSVLVSQLPTLGWQGLFFTMGALCFAVMGATFFVREPSQAASHHAPAERLSWPELGARLKKLVDSSAARLLLLFVATYKLGETFADQLFEPWLVRVAHYEVYVAAGFSAWGMLGSLLGSALGAVIATRFRLLTAVGITAGVRFVPLLGMWAMVAGYLAPTPRDIIALTTVEHFFAGMLTTAMFAYMMSRVDKRIGATHFTLLAAVEVLGKAIPGLSAGALVDAAGWSPVFLAAALLSLAFVGLVPVLRRHEADERAQVV
jgi:MFS family permease